MPIRSTGEKLEKALKKAFGPLPEHQCASNGSAHSFHPPEVAALFHEYDLSREVPIEPESSPRNSPPISIEAGLASARWGWSRQPAAHLLKRTMFGPTFAEIAWSAEQGLETTLDLLLKTDSKPMPPGEWVDESPPNWRTLSAEKRKEIVRLYRQRMTDLGVWWIELMGAEGVSMREMMVLFWHDHFATEAKEVDFPQAMYKQNALFREFAFGNVRELVKRVATDAAMLIYLDGTFNKRGRVNENFARELLELFTIGIGHYSEEDVVEAARACTGWVTNGVNVWYDRNRHDSGSKTFMGKSGRFDVNDIVDIIFEEEETARFLCRKLYRWFVYDRVDEDFVEELAILFRESDYEMIPVLRALFSSEHFYDDQLFGCQIRNPLQLTVGTMRQFNLTGRVPTRLVRTMLYYLGMLPLEPPNVNGWPTQRSWVNAVTLPYRKMFTTILCDGRLPDGGRIGYRIDPADFIGALRNGNDLEKLMEDLILVLFGMEPTPAIRQAIQDELLQGAEPYDWYFGSPGNYERESVERMRHVLRFIMRLPDFQLC